MSVNITGVIVTSRSCSGTCLTFSIPRQPKPTPRSPAAAALRRRARSAQGARPQRTEDRSLGSVRRSCRLLLLDGGGFGSGLVLGRTAREREEHLVETRAVEREVGDSHLGARERGDRLGRTVGVGA